MIIELLKENDNSLELLLKEAFHKDVEKINIEDCLKNNIRFLCAKIDNIVVGSIMITTKYNPVRNKYIYYLDYICVKEEYQNRGIGKSLLDEVEKLAIKEKIKEIVLESNPSRVNARNMYINSGYQIKDTNVFIKVLGE